MSLQPNYKARLERANRHNVPVQSAAASFKRFKWFTLALMILSPIYPSLSALGETNQYGVTMIDDSSILVEFTEDADLQNISEDGFVVIDREKNISLEEIVSFDEKKEAPTPKPESNVKYYEVVQYDDIIKIAKKTGVAAEIILWSNNLTMNDTLVEGQKLKIPPVTGIVHTLKAGETVSDIAKKYNVSVGDILSTNNISDARKIPDGTRLMIPGAKLPEPPVERKVTPKPATPAKTETRSATTAKTNTPVASTPKVETPAITTATINPTTGLKDRYAIKFTGLGRGFVKGNCTWHVARHKTVTWRGNANQWIKNARAQGVPTGKTPVVGAIVQFSGYGYSPQYGHVGFVTDIEGDNIIVSDMNYAGLGVITIRKIPKNHPAIDGYIYVD